MITLNNIKRGLQTMFGYHAIVDKKRRTAPRATTRHEDRELDKFDRRRMIATARENRRNQSLLAWMIRQHLNYVSRFRFQSRTGNAELDARIEDLVKWWSQPRNCDVAGRHGLTEFIRLVEQHRVVDGDIGVLKIADGRLQAIEGDRITEGVIHSRVPAVGPGREICNGVVINGLGQAEKYAISRRIRGEGLEFDRFVRARDMWLLGYYDRFDQVRGISPLATAINNLTDVYEGFEYALVKAKMHAMFGIGIMRSGEEDSPIDGWQHTDFSTGNAPTSGTKRYDFDLRPGLKLELMPGDKIDTIESKTPSNEFQDYSQLMIQVSLLALDIPISFFDSRKSSYSSARQDLLSYVESCKCKRDYLRGWLDDLITWKLEQWSRRPTPEAPLLQLPQGTMVRDLKWEWIPAGIPWIDPLKEIQADAMAIQVGLKSRHQISSERGLNWEDTLIDLEKEEAALIESGITVQVAQPGAVTTRDEEINPEGSPNEMA